MPKVRWAIVLMLAITALLAALLALIPRRSVSEAGGAAGVPAEGAGGAPEPQGPPAEPPAKPEQGEPPAFSALPREERPGPAPPRERPARLAVVIDDVGYNSEALKTFLALPFPLAFAVLPHLAHSAEAGRLIAAAGKELLLHMPMEPINGEDPGPGAIYTSLSDLQIEQALEQALSGLPAAAGMNNHMGSKATADRRVMELVMRFAASRGLYFLDSRTTAESLAGPLAVRHGVPMLARDIFLEQPADPQRIRSAFERAAQLAQHRGRAVLIGHLQDAGLADELARLLPELERRGVHLVAPSVLAQEEIER